jgi:hypothetical protein
MYAYAVNNGQNIGGTWYAGNVSGMLMDLATVHNIAQTCSLSKGWFLSTLELKFDVKLSVFPILGSTLTIPSH